MVYAAGAPNIQAGGTRPVPSDGSDIDTHLQQRIKATYPEKASYLGEDAINALINAGKATARQHVLATDRGVALVVVLMLAFGHGWADDPLYPWIGRTLWDPNIADPAARATRLEKKALVWSKHALANVAPSGAT